MTKQKDRERRHRKIDTAKARERVKSVRVTTTMPLSGVFTWYHTTRIVTTDMALLRVCVCVQLRACVFSVTETLSVCMPAAGDSICLKMKPVIL